MDPASAVNLFDVGDYPVGVAVREDVEGVMDAMDAQAEEDAAFDSLVRQYQAMAESRMQAPELEEERPRKRINVLRSLGIGGIFDG